MIYRNTFVFAIVMLGLVSLAGTVSQAAIWVPTTGTTFNWNTDTNWELPATFPNVVDAIADLSTKNTSSQTIRLNESITIGQLLLGDKSGSNTFTINSDATNVTNGTGSLIFDGGAAGSAGNSTLARVAGGGTGANTINANIEVVDNLLIYSANGTLTLNGALTGTGTIDNALDAAAARQAITFTGDLSGFTGTVKINRAALRDSFSFQAPAVTAGSNDASGARFELNGATEAVPSGFTSGAEGRLNLVRRTTAGDVATFKMGELSGDGGRIQDDYNVAGSFTLEVGHLLTTTETSSEWSGVYATTLTPGLTANLTKVGVGSWTLWGDNLYNGVTSVNEGTLLVNGNHLTGAGYTVASGATLGGTGTIGSSVSLVGGTLAPGASIGTLNIGGSVSMTTGSYDWEFNGGLPPGNIPTTDADVMNVGGALSIASAVSLIGTNFGTNLIGGTKFVAISYFTAGAPGTFSGMPDDSYVIVGGKQWLINYDDTSFAGAANVDRALYGNAVTLTAVPELSSFLTVGLGGIFAIGAVLLGKRYGVAAFRIS